MTGQQGSTPHTSPPAFSHLTKLGILLILIGGSGSSLLRSYGNSDRDIGGTMLAGRRLVSISADAVGLLVVAGMICLMIGILRNRRIDREHRARLAKPPPHE